MDLLDRKQLAVERKDLRSLEYFITPSDCTVVSGPD
jgi:hypothetical protein